MRYDNEAHAAHAELVDQVRTLRERSEQAAPWAAVGRLVDTSHLAEADRAWRPQPQRDLKALSPAGTGQRGR